jgi:hypothetical protein
MTVPPFTIAKFAPDCVGDDRLFGDSLDVERGQATFRDSAKNRKESGNIS